jgi:uncharacterized phage protein (TIGR02218 family)
MAKTTPRDYLDSARQPARSHITLYKLTLQQGTTYFLCDSDTDVTAPDPTASGSPTQTWQSFAHTRSEAKANADLQVDTMDVSVPNARLQFSGQWVTVARMALAGLFDKATVTMLRWNLLTPSEPPFRHSDWVCQTVSVTRRDITLRLESLLAIALRTIPRTIFDEKCNNQLFDQWCGLIRANFQQSVTVVTGSTTGVLLCVVSGAAVFGGQNPSPGQSGYWDLGQVVFTSGVDNGVVRSIKQSLVVGANMQLTLLQPLPFQPAVGDAFSVVPGCDKSIGTCINKFNNLNGQVPPGAPNTPPQGGFRGFPRIPKPTDTL